MKNRRLLETRKDMRAKGNGLRLLVPIVALCLVVSIFLILPNSGGAAPKELKIGALVNLKSQQGIEMQRWLNLFAKMYNEKGGGR